MKSCFLIGPTITCLIIVYSSAVTVFHHELVSPISRGATSIVAGCAWVLTLSYIILNQTLLDDILRANGIVTSVRYVAIMDMIGSFGFSMLAVVIVLVDQIAEPVPLYPYED
eukprot:UN33802